MKSERPLRATYRLQLTPSFTFADAERQVPYLAELGISHLYLSPIFEAAKGSTHGYDVIDHSQVSSALGGRAGFDALVNTAHRHRLGLILDIVPNHMSIADPRNRWWWDVLENGPASPHAHAFDVDWNPPEQQLANVVLLPVLGDHRTKVLERKELQVKRDGARFVITSFEQRFPVAPRALGELLAQTKTRSARLGFIADGLRDLPAPTVGEHLALERRHRDKSVLFELLAELISADPTIPEAIDEVLAQLNADASALSTFLDRQNHRLAFWRTADRELDYRRFFDVTTLVALRMEDQRVFADTHRLIAELHEQGAIDGVRVDHVDGLADPAEYLRRLRALLPGATIHVEKILGFDEQLPPWPVEGTTGYEHAAEVTQLSLNPRTLPALVERAERLTGANADFHALASAAREHVLVELLAADVNRLTANLVELRERHPDLRDYSRHALQKTLRALVAAFPVYRSYVAPSRGEISDDDRRLIRAAVEAAAGAHPELERPLFDLIASFLELQRKGELEARFVHRFQQLTAPAMAKGVEDTAFYRDARLLAVDEVGNSPEHFGLSVEAFHRRQQLAHQRWPHRLLASSTHDTKRGEDLRARLVAASWNPSAWPAPIQGEVDGLTREVLLQTLIGGWPLTEARLWPAMEKAIREAKLQTSWLSPQPQYEEKVKALVSRVLADVELKARLEAFVRSLDPLARRVSLGWTTLKLTVPGVPDLYQGSERWNFSLVDPDNRRPVDYEASQRALHDSSVDGAPKAQLIRTLLDLRRRRPHCFDERGTYEPVRSTAGDEVVAFMRAREVVVVVARSPRTDWETMTITLPEGTFESALEASVPHSGLVSLQSILGERGHAVLEARR